MVDRTTASRAAVRRTVDALVRQTMEAIMPADWEIPMAKIVQESDADLLRKVRDMFVKGHPGQNATQQVYFSAFLSQLADRIERDQARNVRLCAKLKDLTRRAKAGELDTPNNSIREPDFGNIPLPHPATKNRTSG